MRLIWSEEAWEDYFFWQQEDKKILKKVNQLIADIKRDPFKGIGNPEPLKFNLSKYWSRRITKEHRLVYKVENQDNLLIVQCRYHY